MALCMCAPGRLHTSPHRHLCVAVPHLDTSCFRRLLSHTQILSPHCAVNTACCCWPHWVNTRELQRLENLSRSPLTSQLSESIDGCCTIRAYGAVQRHIDCHDGLLDRNSQALLSLKTAEVPGTIRAILLTRAFRCG